MPRPKSTGRPPAEEELLRTLALLEIAAQVFLEQGYEAASTTEIARRANASKQTFYMRYPTKEKLFLAVIDYRTTKLSEQFSLIFAKSDPVRHVLVETARTLLSAILSKEHIALLRIVYMEAPQFPEAAKLLAERGPDRGTSALAEYLSVQSRQGFLDLEDSLVAAQQFGGLVVGDLVHRALLGLINPKLKSLLQTRVETSVDAFLKIYARSHGIP
jgi:TetR/AcrR family transcriptional repressor of mexJK operon